MITDGVLEPMELAHLPYRKGRTDEDCVGARGLRRFGKKRGRLAEVVTPLQAALEADDIVVRGGNAKRLGDVPPGARMVDGVRRAPQATG